MSLNNIEAVRLLLIPVTYEITSALMDGSNNEVEKLGIRTAENWPTMDTMDILPLINKSLEKSPPSGFEFWMIVDKATSLVIGDIGFHGKPNDIGEVEVGFGLVEKDRRKGFGYEALEAIMNWLNSQNSVKLVKADCLVDNLPSARILEKVGMKEIKRDQTLIYWEFVK